MENTFPQEQVDLGRLELVLAGGYIVSVIHYFVDNAALCDL